MRQVGKLSDEQQADRFVDYLFATGVVAQAEEAADAWSIWVRDENDLAVAREELERFRANPRDERFEAAHAAREMRQADQKKAVQSRKRHVRMQQRWNRPVTQRRPVVIALIVASVAATAFSSMGRNKTGGVMRSLLFCDTMQDANWNIDSVSDRLINIKSGEVWRLVTPIFVHYGGMHLFFNLYMLYQFGGMLEEHYGSYRLALLALFTAVASNMAQSLAPFPLTFPFEGGASPFAAGMSGVLYGVFGFLWAKSLWDRSNAVPLSSNLVMFLLIWLVLGIAGVLNLVLHINIANWAHAIGLASGMLAGYASSFSIRGHS